MTGERRLQIGFMANEASPERVRDLEDRGVDSLWAAGHVTAPVPMREALTGLVRLATLAERATVGTAVLALPLYQPGLLAKQLAEVDRWTEGRSVVGIGVGGEYPEEFRACQVPFGERGPRTDEAIEVLRRLWSGEEASHDGRFFSIERVKIAPPPVQPGGPPIVVAGRKERAMRRAALLGDGWMPYLYSASRYASSVERIRSLAEQAGRSLDGFHWTACVFLRVDDDSDRARAQAAAGLGGSLRAEGNPDFATIVDRVAVAGDRDDVVAGLQAFVDAGADHLILTPLGSQGDGGRQVDRLLAEVVPELRSNAVG